LKAIYHIGARQADISRLAGRFPQIAFDATRSDAALVAAIATAEILLINGNEFSLAVSGAVHASPSLKCIQFTSSGIDVALRSGGFPTRIQAANVAGLRAANLSEHAFAMLLFLTRRLRMVETARAGRAWPTQQIFPHAVSLKGRTMLIIGLGAIGQAAARKARGFDMRVMGVSRGYRADALVERVFSRTEALDAFREADVTLVAAPSEEGTRGLVGEAALAAMKPSAIVINVSRGAIIDEAALAAACREGRIAGAGLDVTVAEPLAGDSPLWGLDNVLITPHIGGAGSDQLGQLLDMVGDNIQRYLAGEPLANVVSA
jgi:phosphoglycerate dehydrogenase-like enzyme